jgi:hypothetical protein
MSELTHLQCSIGPHEQLRVRELLEDGEPVDPALAARILESFTRSQADGLFHLACIELQVHLPTVLKYWQAYGRQFITTVCALPDLKEARSCESLPMPKSWIQEFYLQAPPQRGLDFLTAQVLEKLWQEMKGHFDEHLGHYDGSIQDLLSSLNATWNLVGRVYFHLAENKRDADLPFAFMSSYTTRLDKQARPQYLPLATGHSGIF